MGTPGKCTIYAVIVGMVAACAADAPPTGDNVLQIMLPDADAPVIWPDVFLIIGSGYPNAGDPCRRIGENAATADFLRDGTILVGCPTPAGATLLRGRAIADVQGITLVSVPIADIRSRAARAAESRDDAAGAAMSYEATAWLPCGIAGRIDRLCRARVGRRAPQDGVAAVDIEKPDGGMRVIWYEGGRALGANRSQVDGSAAYRFSAQRQRTQTLIAYGPERYRVPNSFILGI